MHGKWRGDNTEEYTAKFRPSYATPLSQLIYLLYAHGKMHPMLGGCHITLKIYHMSTCEGATWHCMDDDRTY
jgi:hypothetical protein